MPAGNCAQLSACSERAARTPSRAPSSPLSAYSLQTSARSSQFAGRQMVVGRINCLGQSAAHRLRLTVCGTQTAEDSLPERNKKHAQPATCPLVAPQFRATSALSGRSLLALWLLCSSSPLSVRRPLLAARLREKPASLAPEADACRPRADVARGARAVCATGNWADASIECAASNRVSPARRGSFHFHRRCFHRPRAALSWWAASTEPAEAAPGRWQFDTSAWGRRGRAESSLGQPCVTRQLVSRRDSLQSGRAMRPRARPQHSPETVCSGPVRRSLRASREEHSRKHALLAALEPRWAKFGARASRLKCARDSTANFGLTVRSVCALCREPHSSPPFWPNFSPQMRHTARANRPDAIMAPHTLISARRLIWPPNLPPCRLASPSLWLSVTRRANRTEQERPTRHSPAVNINLSGSPAPNWASRRPGRWATITSSTGRPSAPLARH